MNTFEYTNIKDSKVPNEWKSDYYNGFSDFLQQNWDERVALFTDDDTKKKQQFITFNGPSGITTKGYIGTIVYRGVQLNIYPRVFKENKDDRDTDELNQEYLMKNLIQWISYCNRISYPYINISAELSDSKDLKELFITLYIAYVSSALERGVFFQYVDEIKNVRSIKGKLNVCDYIINKVPNGKYDEFECKYSKFEFDNQVNRIIKYTCMQLYKIANIKAQKKIYKILSRLEEVSLETCKPSDCDGIRLDRNHSNYRIIISMSKMFLLNMLSNLTMDMNDSFCFLFPTYLLFEGFIGGFIQDIIEDEGGRVALQKSDVSLFDKIFFEGKEHASSHQLRHDIFVEKNNKCFILDTKYKEIDRFSNCEDISEIINREISQEDLYQVCVYAIKRNLHDVYLLYPMYRFEENETSDPPRGNVPIKDSNETVLVHFVRLPFVFNDNEKIVKERLKTVILNILK